MKRAFIIIGLTAALAIPGMGWAQSNDAQSNDISNVVVVYSPWKDSVMQKLGAAFKAKTGITLKSINMSTGQIMSRLRAEKNHPQADVWHSVRALFLAQAEKLGLIAAYTPPNAKYVLKKYRYPDNPYIIGTTMYPMTIIYNTKLIKKTGVKPPDEWSDLLKPVWDNKIVMPDPAASGTAFAFLTTMIRSKRASGESGIESKKGWGYMRDLVGQVAQFTDSGTAPAAFVARGEFPVGIVFYDRVYQFQHEGYPVKATFPAPVYAEPSCTAVIANAPHPKAARKFLNFMLSPKAQKIAKTLGNYSVRPDIAPPEGAPPLKKLDIFKNANFRWAAKYKQELLRKFLRIQHGS